MNVRLEPGISVVVPSVGRPEALRSCLIGVLQQTVPATEVITVLRQTDSESRAVAASFGETVRIVDAPRGGVVAALLAGGRAARSEWVAFLDDDAIPDRRWLEVLSSHIDDPSVGGVGGRIVNIVDGRQHGVRGRFTNVARLDWWSGRAKSRLWDEPVERLVIDVDFLPGSNMCYRRFVVTDIPMSLDYGMCPTHELEFALSAKARHLRVVYDSDAVVLHYPKARGAGVPRGDRVGYAAEYSRSLTFILVRHLSGVRAAAFVAYFLLVGHKVAPGPLLSAYHFLRGDIAGAALTVVATREKLGGLKEGLESRFGQPR